ncbi:MAG: hypothetical protein IJ404_00820 [Clostridia bacterium]|nr:hypothetical protein [Clostridia bacterium]
MIKGINKNMIVVKNTGSRYFEEAHFIIKNCASDRSERDLVKEASKIVGTVLTENGKVSKPKRGIIKGLITVLLSFISGAALGILLCLLS